MALWPGDRRYQCWPQEVQGPHTQLTVALSPENKEKEVNTVGDPRHKPTLDFLIFNISGLGTPRAQSRKSSATQAWNKKEVSATGNE